MASLYPQYYEPFDPEERRRRMLLNPEEDSGGDDPNEPPSTMSEEDDPEPVEVPEDVPAGPSGESSSINLSPAQRRYSEALQAMPRPGDYKPSRGRRALAAIAGGLTGLRDPRLGVSVATDIVSQPYNMAERNWRNTMTSAQGMAGIEKEASAQDVARRRASAYERNASARERQATATEAFRQYQQNHMPWAPQNQEQAEAMEKLKHPQRPVPWAPGSKEEYMQVHPARPVNDPLKVEGLRHSNRMAEQAAHDNRVAALRRDLAKNTRTGVPANPQQQLQAEHLAAQQLIRTNPDYKAFYDEGDPTRKIPPRIKGIDDLPKSGGMFSSVTPAQESLARDRYRQFLSDLDKGKKAILGSKATGGSQWDIQPDEEDEEDDQ